MSWILIGLTAFAPIAMSMCRSKNEVEKVDAKIEGSFGRSQASNQTNKYKISQKAKEKFVKKFEKVQREMKRHDEDAGQEVMAKFLLNLDQEELDVYCREFLVRPMNALLSLGLLNASDKCSSENIKAIREIVTEFLDELNTPASRKLLNEYEKCKWAQFG